MKNPELYSKTVGILEDAYFNDTLVNGDCGACAVGNLVAANCGYKIEKFMGTTEWFSKKNKVKSPLWNNVVVSNVIFWPFKPKQRTNLSYFEGKARKQIESTGYTLQEFAKIEVAFEYGSSKWYKKDKMFSGLMSVIEALDIIHENTDTQVTTESKNKFNKKLTTT